MTVAFLTVANNKLSGSWVQLDDGSLKIEVTNPASYTYRFLGKVEGSELRGEFWFANSRTGRGQSMFGEKSFTRY
jgi:hypothetical protein